MISPTSLQAFSVGTQAASPRGAPNLRLPGMGAVTGGTVASADEGDGGGFTLPVVPPGRILPRGSLLDITV